MALVALWAAGCGAVTCRDWNVAEAVWLGKNPFAGAQPTARGRRIHTLEGWRGELYMGYGDYDENTGPVRVSAYDPRTRGFGGKLRFDSEAIELYRPIGGRLYAPAIDPLGDGQSATVAIGEADGRWTANREAFVTHAFDATTLDGRDVWLVGSRGFRAVALRSLDGGRTWGLALDVGPRSGRRDDFTRFYFAFAHAGRFYVQAEDRLGGSAPRSLVFDGTAWSEGPDLEPVPGTGAKPLAVAGEVVYLGRAGIMAFDGHAVRRVRSTRARPVDLTVADGVLYVLEGRDVTATRDLARWAEVAVAPPDTTSVGVLDGFLYAGTADAGLWRLRPACLPDPGR